MEAAKKAPSWVTRILLPEISEMKGGIKALNTKVDSMRVELKTEIRALSEKVDIVPSLAVLEAKMKELENRK
jgi:hypothetical protein